ncbi:MAG: thermonuclease family protein [Pseudomonadota bacterium]
MPILRSQKALILGAFLFCPTPLWASETDCPPDRIDGTFQVAKVHDGDTVRLRSGDKVRFIGINSPEIGRDGAPSQPFAQKARRFLEATLRANRNIVNLRLGNERRDHYGRLLAHPYLADNRSIAALMLTEGLAAQITIPPNIFNADCYVRAEGSARERNNGIWSHKSTWGRQAASLKPHHRGFQIVYGRVHHLKSSRGRVFFKLDNTLDVEIGKQDLRYFNPEQLRQLEGASVRIRGWISKRNNTLRLRHPNSLTVE